MKFLLVSLLVALPLFVSGDLVVNLLRLEKEEVSQCAIHAGVPNDTIAEVINKQELPDSEKDTCKLVMCSLQDKKFITDGRLDHAAAVAKFQKEVPTMFPAKSAVREFSKCAQKVDGQGACKEALDFLYCILYSGLKYSSPLLDSTTSDTIECQKENNVSDGDVNKLDYKAEIPKSRGGKCMLACLLKAKGAIFENKLDASYIHYKILDNIEGSPVERSATSESEFREDFKKCSPNITDPAGTKDVCEGAYNLYDCVYKTQKKYYLRGIANN